MQKNRKRAETQSYFKILCISSAPSRLCSSNFSAQPHLKSSMQIIQCFSISSAFPRLLYSMRRLELVNYKPQSHGGTEFHGGILCISLAPPRLCGSNFFSTTSLKK